MQSEKYLKKEVIYLERITTEKNTCYRMSSKIFQTVFVRNQI